MRPDIVVDIGNSRMKWGRCPELQRLAHDASHTALDKACAALPSDDPAAWQVQLASWELHHRLVWVVCSVHPERRALLTGWLRQRGDTVHVLERAEQLPVHVLVDYPERVGIDRLLNALAANARRCQEAPAVVIDAGSAITVDWVDQNGAFAGGAILPGLRLMARALHEQTALLPLIEIRTLSPAVPGKSTAAAIEAGVFWAAAGGVGALIKQLSQLPGNRSRSDSLQIFLTGGDAVVLEPALQEGLQNSCRLLCWPFMTLEGIRLAAEALP